MNLYDDKNIFAKILRDEIPCVSVFSDDFCLAFNDIEPQSPIHVVVIPKGNFIDFGHFHENASPEMVVGFYQGIQKTIEKLNLANGYRILSNKGKIGGQTVFHYHVHILAGKELSAKIVTSL